MHPRGMGQTARGTLSFGGYTIDPPILDMGFVRAVWCALWHLARIECSHMSPDVHFIYFTAVETT